MKRASYRHACWWIAENDSAGNDDALDVESVAGYISTCLVADIFGVEQERVAADVVRYRQQNRDDRERIARIEANLAQRREQ